MKKKIVVGIVIAIVFILLIPIPMRLKDGGSIEFKAILYTIIKYHQIDLNSETGYIDGIGIEILGKEIYNNMKEKEDGPSVKKADSNMKMVLSLEDEIQDNTIWCGTFNLIWNDLKNDLAKQDIAFTPQLDVVKNLNKGTFTTKNLSEDSYYKIYGTPTLELKKQIEKAIKTKFHETSDILDDFDWENYESNDYFLYAMLKKEFEFPKVFTELENDKFGNYENVKYFGINESTEDTVREQVQVLYYKTKEDFAIKLITTGNDEVIIARGNKKNTFGDMYQEITQTSKEYEGNRNFSENDKLKIPNISFNQKEELKELENKPFQFSNGDIYIIDKALQTVQFDLDRKGGKIKSEAGMMSKTSGILAKDIREFIVDDTFTIFLKEKEKDLPYFAAKISDISKVQNEVIKLNDTKEQNQVSKLSKMYMTMIEDSMASDQALQSDIEFIAIDFSNFRRPLTELEKSEKYNLPNFNTKEEKEEWERKIKSKPIDDETKQEIVEYLKEKYPEVEVKQNTYKELEEQGFATKDRGIKDGIILYVPKLPEIIEEDEAKIKLTKYRSPRGANFNEYEMKYTDKEWQLKIVSSAIS